MDNIFKSIDRFLEGGRGVMDDVKHILIHPETIIDQMNKLDWRANTSLILLMTAATAFISMYLLANFTNVGGTAELIKEKAPIVKPGAPPIPPPTEVVSLRIYPIKSCRGIEVKSTRLRKSGLTLDRNWMFIEKSDRKFMTIRGDASMTLIDTALVEDEKTKEQMLEVSIHGTDARVLVPAFPTKEWLEANTTLGTVEIWEKETDAWEYGDHINKVFNDYFNKPVALVYKGPTARMVAVNGSKELYGKETPHHFADVMSLQVASEASIKDLNRRLSLKSNAPSDLTIERFRPNIIVRGRDEHPWEEDTWKRVRIVTTIHEELAIYKLELDTVARCARCQVPNVNPDTAEKHAKEPWDELMKFRRDCSQCCGSGFQQANISAGVDTGGPAKYKPCFGMLCIPRNEGKIEVGAKLEVLETTSNHLYNTRKFSEL
jgi:hypothetical protein